MKAQTLIELTQALHRKTISSVELTTEYLDRIRQYHFLNAFISINDTHVLEEARLADTCIAKGEATPLTGIPIAHKDIFCTTTMPTTCASRMLANFQAPYAATLVSDLTAQHVVVLGKTNMDEFAMGSTNETSYFGAVKNPWNTKHVPGGSSGGSAAAVAASLCAFASGSDTGGSIRQPAAFCGITGLKPTYGLISRYGMVAFASSLDTAGIMARSAEDIALVMQTVARFDEKDSTSTQQPGLSNYLQQTHEPPKSFRIGLPREYLNSNINPDIQLAIQNAVRVFEQLGAEIVEVDIQLQPQWVPCYYILACAEASSNLSRYDGIRYGHRSTEQATLRELITHSRDEGFGIEVKRRILTGTHVLSSGYYDDYYVHAQKVRSMIRDELRNLLSTVDMILGPTTPDCASLIGQKITDPTQLYLADIFTVGANLAGLPALSIPAGFNRDGLPIGMQLLGAHFNEARLLQLAYHYQQRTNWHLMTPSLTMETL